PRYNQALHLSPGARRAATLWRTAVRRLMTEITMASPNSMMWTSASIVATLMIGVPSLSGAQERGAGPVGAPAGQGQGQGRGRGRGAPPFTPAAGAKDLKSVMF